MKKAFIVLLVVFTLYSLYGLVAQIDYDVFKKMIYGLAPFWWLYLLFSVLANVLATKAWILLDDSHQLKTISYWDLFFLRQAGESLGQLNPTGALGGDYLKYTVLKKKVEPHTINNPLYLFRIYSIISYFCIVAITLLIYVLYFYHKPGWLQILAVLLLSALLFFMFRILKKIPAILLRFLVFLHKFIHFKPVVFEKFTVFSNQIKSLKFKKSHVVPLVLLIFHWIIGSLEIYGIARLFDINISAIQSIIVDFGVMVFKTAGQVIPAQLGIEEVGNSYMLKVFGGFTAAAWLGLSILRRLRQLAWIVISLIYMMYVQKIKHLIQPQR